jgi:hypothetical protein
VQPDFPAKLFFYGPHMFWSRFVKDKGYKDGFPGLILALAFSYMESLQYWIYGFTLFWKDLLILVCLGTFHLFILYSTPFINWPEMLLYPWLVIRQRMNLFTEAVITYPPGSILALGALFEIFGYSLPSARLIAYLFIVFIDITVYIIVRKITGRRSTGTGAVLLFTLCTVFFEGNTLWFETMMTPLYLVSFYSLVRFLSTRNTRYLYYTALISSLSFLIKQTGVLSFGAIAGVIMLASQKFRQAMKQIFISLGIFLLLPSLAFLYFILTKRGGEFIYWVVVMVSEFSKNGSGYALFPTRSDVLYSSPLIFMFLITVTLCVSFLKDRRWSVPLLSFSIISVIGAFPRFGFHRLIPACAFLSIGMAFGANEWRKRNRGIALFFLSLLIGIFFVLIPKYLHRVKTLPQFFTQKERELARFMEEKTNGEPFAIVGDYDYMYFLMDKRPSVIPWIQLFPAPADAPGLQYTLIESLKSQNIRYVFVIPYHPDNVFFGGRRPEKLLQYIENVYTKDIDLPLKGFLYVRR